MLRRGAWLRLSVQADLESKFKLSKGCHDASLDSSSREDLLMNLRSSLTPFSRGTLDLPIRELAIPDADTRSGFHKAQVRHTALANESSKTLANCKR